MKLRNNTPKIFSKYQDQSLRTANIEDGNTVAGVKQGKINVSQLDYNDGYNGTNDYVGDVVYAIPMVSDTGTFYNYKIAVQYTAYLEGQPFSYSAASFTNTGTMIDGTYENVPTYDLFGSGATFTVVVLGGNIFSVTMASPGTGYYSFSSVYIDGASIGGTIVNNIYFTSSVVDPTVPGYYGSNLIKENDAFMIKGFFGANFAPKDYIRGFINKIVSIQDNLSGQFTVFRYTLYCTIVQGDGEDLLNVAKGTQFSWNRQRYMDETTFNEAYPPAQLSGSFNKSTYDFYIYWNDINQSSRKYQVNFRNSVVTNFSTLLYVTGTKSNFEGALQPIIDVNTTDISTIKIVDPGKGTHSWRSIDIKGTGSGSCWAAQFNYDGALSIEEYVVVNCNIATNTITIRSKSTKPYPCEDLYNSVFPLPLKDSYIEGLPPLLFGEYRVNSYISTGSGVFDVDIEYAEDSTTSPIIPISWTSDVVGTTIKIHNGVVRANNKGFSLAGGGYGVVTTVTGSNKAVLNPMFLPFYLNSDIGTNVLGVFPSGTYITEIYTTHLILSNAALSTAATAIWSTGSGRGYTGKARAKVKEIPNNVRCYVDPIYANSLAGIDLTTLATDLIAISVAAIYSEDGKKYTEWTEEEYIKP